jgi:hypothetical protein
MEQENEVLFLDTTPVEIPKEVVSDTKSENNGHCHFF